MEIIIGKTGNQPFPLTEMSISRQHAVFRMDEKTGKMYLRDNNSTNGTYILKNNSFIRVTKEIPVTQNTEVRLGAKHTFFIKQLVAEKEPETVDISGLKMIYEAYNSNKMDLDMKQSNIMMIRMHRCRSAVFSVSSCRCLSRMILWETKPSAPW